MFTESEFTMCVKTNGSYEILKKIVGVYSKTLSVRSNTVKNKIQQFECKCRPRLNNNHGC